MTTAQKKDAVYAAGAAVIIFVGAIFLISSFHGMIDRMVMPDVVSLDQAVTFCVEGSTDPDRIIDCYEAVYGGHHRRVELSQQELDAVTIKCRAQTGRAFECIDAVY